MRWTMILCALWMAAVGAAQDKAPVVLVWGEYLAAANPGEASGTRSYLNAIASALDAVGVPYLRTSDSRVAQGVLEGHKFAFFPYNAHLPPEVQDGIRRFVRDGGKIWASFTRDPVLNELLGVRVTGSVRPEDPARLRSMQFGPDAPAGTPPTVLNDSWQTHSLQTLEGTRVIATWADREGNDTGLPAVTMNENGYYHAHVMLSDDFPEKGRMFLALIGEFVPDLWQDASRRAIEEAGDIHGYESWDAVAEALAQAEAEGRDVAVARARLEAAREHRTAARRLLEAGRHPDALERAMQAKDNLRAATFPLARSREGELRAVWLAGARVDDWHAVMQDLAAGGFNAVFPSLCDAGGADYESEVLPRAAGYRGDQLAACIEAARPYGIEVHPWRINWRISRGTREHQDRLRAEGRLTRSVDGTDGDWLCPSDPRNLQLEIDAMVEMAEKYPVAGVHFDYIRYHNANYCYCDKCEANFQRDAQVQVAQWPADVRAGGPHYDVFQQWRQEQITRLVREVYRRVKQTRPWVVVSAAVFSNWHASPVSIGQNAAAWAEEGIIDLLMPMTYTNSNDSLANLTRQHVELTRGRAVLAEGIGAFSSHSQFSGPDQLIRQIETARSLGADGFCIFHYGSALQRGGFLPALAEGATGPQTFTPALEPPTRFAVNADADGEWVFGPAEPLALQATSEATGPWPTQLASVEARFTLQGLDGRDLRPLGEVQTTPAGREARWQVTTPLEAGGYRLAVSGSLRFADDTRRGFITRSRPLRVLDADEYAIHRGLLPAPRPPDGRPRVGVLADGYGGRGMIAALRRMGDIEVEPVEQINADTARRFQALIITQGRAGVSVDERLAAALRGWIASGGGLMATHDAVGFRGHAPIAPEVCGRGLDNPRTTEVVLGEAPLVPEEYRGATLSHAFYDHITLEPGERGQVIAANRDGAPVVVAGLVGQGRFVASGIAFGLDADTQEREPVGEEAQLLRELTLWIAGAR